MPLAQKTKARRSFVKDALAVAAAAAVVFTARASLADHYHVPSGSMEPTVAIGDHVIVNKLAYGVRAPLGSGYLIRRDGPERGDVVVLESPEGGTTLLKRVVAGPDDLVQVMDGQLVLNGQKVELDTHPANTMEKLGARTHEISLEMGGGPDFGPVKVPAGNYLVMGDNRGNSRDGRSFGFVKRDAILGRVSAIVIRKGSPTWRSL